MEKRTVKYEGITRIIMGSEINGRVPYHEAVYLVDDVLIDTGSYHGRMGYVTLLGGSGYLKGSEYPSSHGPYRSQQVAYGST